MDDIDEDFLRVLGGGVLVALGLVALAYSTTALPPGYRIRLVFVPLFAGASDLPFAGWASIVGPIVAYVGWVVLQSGLNGTGEDKRRRANFGVRGDPSESWASIFECFAPSDSRQTFASKYDLNPDLEAIVGKGPLTRDEVGRRMWEYLEAHDLLHKSRDLLSIQTDEALRRIVGETKRTNLSTLLRKASAKMRATTSHTTTGEDLWRGS